MKHKEMIEVLKKVINAKEGDCIPKNWIEALSLAIEKLEEMDKELNHRKQDTFTAVIAGMALGKVNQQALSIAHRLKNYTDLRKIELIVNSTEQQDKIDVLEAEITLLKKKAKVDVGEIEKALKRIEELIGQ